MDKILGIDISSWQGDIDFKQVAADGIKFAIIRQGFRNSIDNKFLDYVKGCQENNIYIMVYHFIYNDTITIDENALSTYNNIKLAGLDPEKIWIAADLEYDTWRKNNEICTKEKCTIYTKQYLDALRELGCNKLFIYSNQDYYDHYYDWSQLKYPIWLANYTPDVIKEDCVIRQYSFYGKVNGITVDAVNLNWLFNEEMITNDAATADTITNKRKKNSKTKKTTTQQPVKKEDKSIDKMKQQYPDILFNQSINKKYQTIHCLNMRKAPNLKANVITIIPNEADVICQGYYINDWYYVKYNGFSGFCMKKYLK